jgi:transcriptional regulator with XRE-family HTH domain
MTRIREYRSNRGMTLRDLARDAGVSVGLISQVERGVTDPSLETLRRIAEVLGVPLFSLLQDADTSAVAVVRRGDRLQISSPHTAITYTRASSGSGRLEVLEGRLEPGAVSAEAPRGHPSEECVVVLTGRLTVEVGSELLVLDAGDSCHYDSTVPHRYRNESDDVATFMICITPPSY